MKKFQQLLIKWLGVRMLKIWSDKKYLRCLKDTRPMLLPFFNPELKEDGPESGRFDKWISEAQSIITMTNLDQSDVVIYPQDPTIDKNGFLEFQAITAPKPLIVFFNSDSDQSIPVRDGGVLFRTSGLKSKSKPNERGLPAWSADYGQFEPRFRNDKPSIGFCGQDFRPTLRAQILNILEGSAFEIDFIRKKEFWGGLFAGGEKTNHGLELREEFVQNMTNNDYNVCMRGGGNFSYRLYETMSAGRIPILVDTDCILPLCLYSTESKNLFPIINQNELSTAAERIQSFHSLHITDFKEIQNRIRRFWVNHLSPIGFFTDMAKEFTNS